MAARSMRDLHPHMPTPLAEFERQEEQRREIEKEEAALEPEPEPAYTPPDLEEPGD